MGTTNRRCFPAPPGYVVVERDYGQGELRVIACIANEDEHDRGVQVGHRHCMSKQPLRLQATRTRLLIALEQTDLHTL